MTILRLERVRDALRIRGVDALVVGPGTDLRWLLGFAIKLSERPTVAVVRADGPVVLVTPAFEVPIAARAGVGDLADLVGWSDGEDGLGAVLAALGDATSIAISDALPSGWLLGLQRALPEARFVGGSEVISPLRMVKEPQEIAALQAAGAAIDRVHEQVQALLVAGRTEDEVADDIAALIAADHDAVGFVIVGSGPNGAIPHHDHGPRLLVQGDPVVVDIGGPREGYWSDCTRTYVVGGPQLATDEFRAMHALCVEAQQLAFAAARPGMRASDVDAVAREHLTAAGHGEHFTHRTGHGIGLDGHEAPYLVAGGDVVLEAGMSFSIEPGIYIPDLHGVRIEDIVVLTDDGAVSCNNVPHALG